MNQMTPTHFQPRWFSLPTHGAMPFDPWLLSAAVALILTGFIMITSASMDVAAEKFGGPFFFTLRHGFFIALALIGGVIAVRIPLSVWDKYGPLLLLLGFVLLLVVLIPGIGREVNGSRRWIGLGPRTYRHRKWQNSVWWFMWAVIWYAGFLRCVPVGKGW